MNLLFTLAFLLKFPDTFSPELLVRDFASGLPSHHLEGLALEGPFTYLGNGDQSMAFTDGKLVIKFFLLNPFKQHIRFGKKRPKRTEPRTDILERYNLASQLIPEETGLLATHFGIEGDLPRCTLIGPKGRAFTIDLKRYTFVVQKKAEPATRTDPFGPLVESIAKKGFVNLGETFNLENFGSLDGKAIMFDVGNLAYCSLTLNDPRKELFKVRQKLHTFYKEPATLRP